MIIKIAVISYLNKHEIILYAFLTSIYELRTLSGTSSVYGNSDTKGIY